MFVFFILAYSFILTTICGSPHFIMNKSYVIIKLNHKFENQNSLEG